MANKKIDINKAGIEELSSLSGVGRAKAEAIIETRKALGGFKTIKDLQNVPSIGRSILELNQGLICCGKPAKDGTQSSEAYCLRDRGDGAIPTSTTPPNSSPPSSVGSYCLRERGEASKATRNSTPLKNCHETPMTCNNTQCSAFGSNSKGNHPKELTSVNSDKSTTCTNASGGNHQRQRGDEKVKTHSNSSSILGDVFSDDSNESDSSQEYSSKHSSSAIGNTVTTTKQTDSPPQGHNHRFTKTSPSSSKATGGCSRGGPFCCAPSCLGGDGDAVGTSDEGGCARCQGEESGGLQGMAGALRSRSSLAGVDKSVMKRKSEGGGSKDGSPEKKPCRTSSEGIKSNDGHTHNSSSTTTHHSGTKSTTTEKPTHPFLRNGRIPSKNNPPPDMDNWLSVFEGWSHAERLMVLDKLMEKCEPAQVRHVMQVIEPQFQRDFISLLPKELALHVLSFLSPMDLCRAAQTCQYWRVLAEDNLLWREKCHEENIDDKFVTENRKRHSSSSGGSGGGGGGIGGTGGGGGGGRRASVSKSPWKAAFLRQQQIEHNWREAKIRPQKVLRGHDDHVITCLEFYGDKIVSGSDDNTLKVWSAITGECLRTLVGHTGGVWSSQMRDGIIISGSTDRTLKVWSAASGECEHTLYGHTSTVRCMCLYQNKVVSGSRDATLRVWDVQSGTCLHVLMGHVAAVRCVQYDGRRVVSGAYDYMVKVWDPETETCLHTLSGHTNRVYSLQFDGTHIVSGSLDTSIRVWEVETGQCLHTLIGHQSLTSGMELKDNILVSGNADSTVKVWDITTGLCLQTLQGVFKHQSAVTCLQFNKKFVITSSDDGTVKMWSLKTGCFLRNLVSLESGGSGGVVWRIRASNTKLVCAVGSRNGTEETKLLVLNFDVDANQESSLEAGGDGATGVGGSCSSEIEEYSTRNNHNLDVGVAEPIPT